MKILTWNMAGAGFHSKLKHAEAKEWLIHEAVFDIALLQEALPITDVGNSFIANIFAKRLHRKGPESGWGNAILSRSVSLHQQPILAPRPWTEIVNNCTVVAYSEEINLWIANVHSNAKPIQSAPLIDFKADGGAHCHDTKYWEVEVVAHFLRDQLIDERFVFGGDVNSSLLLDKVYRHSNNARLWKNLEMQGFYDLRLGHFKTEQQTFFRNNTHPYQLDHLFGDETTKKSTSSWEVLTHVARDLQLSDHAPILVEIHL